MTEDRLKEIEARLERAPQPNWKIDWNDDGSFDLLYACEPGIPDDYSHCYIFRSVHFAESWSRESIELIEKAPEDVRYLLGQLRDVLFVQRNTAHCLKASEEENARLREALKHSQAAMTYAYEDHNDQYYLNVQKQIREALEGSEK
jgi:hypothetical protein